MSFIIYKDIFRKRIYAYEDAERGTQPGHLLIGLAQPVGKFHIG